ncbi:hypothetical protein [Nonomuraea sp. NPDC049480]|uniref:hypothetical protein n=1 Tax=Nonomuraea sp. NPDC049480 TaxID=3364353 RepID=UPI003794025F
MLSRHIVGDVIRYSELLPAIRALDISVERVGEVLAELGVQHPGREDRLLERLDLDPFNRIIQPRSTGRGRSTDART